ncbi:MAG: HAD hydrolase family protein [Oscillospiraceae bacterium]|nr:HAD hydrolase family protein [Oscillospiraceae bacterium]
MMKKRYLFFDIDGTLITGGYGVGNIPASAREALHRLKQNGHFLAIATGRSQAMAFDIMQSLGLENMVSDGGNGITINGILLGIEPICKEDVVALVHECEERGFPWGLQNDNSKERLTPDNRFLEATRDTYLKTRIVPGLRAEDQDKIYKAFVACPYPQELTLRTLSCLPWCRFHDSYFFVEPNDKAIGIRKIMDYFHAPYEDAIVFGDSGNDLSMFTNEWTKVAMGNAIPELKEKADLVTTDVAEDGIFHACQALGLI